MPMRIPPRLLRCALAGAAAFIAAAGGTARADSIDGNWCAPDGRQMRIDGPQITTPTGARVSGEYGRHEFSYETPGAGARVTMRMLNDSTVSLRPSQSCERTETWRRCQAPIS